MPQRKTLLQLHKIKIRYYGDSLAAAPTRRAPTHLDIPEASGLSSHILMTALMRCSSYSCPRAVLVRSVVERLMKS